MNRLGEGIMNRHAFFDTIIIRWAAHSKVCQPLRECFFNSVHFDNVVRSFIVRLLLYISPSTIFGTIVTIVINAINRVFLGRSLSHIFKKVFKGIKPSIAHFYSPFAIITIVLVCFIVTPSFHIEPSIVFWCFSFAMFGLSLFYCVDLVATTRLCIPVFQITTLNNNNIPTFTKTFPKNSDATFMPFVVGLFYYRKPIKFVSGKIRGADTPTRFSLSTCEAISSDNFLVSTIANTFPICPFFGGVTESNNNKSSELSSSEIKFWRHNIILTAKNSRRW